MSQRLKTAATPVVIAVMALSTTACTTLTNAGQSLGDHLGISNQSGAAATGGAILGCVGGAAVGGAIGAFTGHPLQAAAMGCGAGGLALGYMSYAASVQKQLDNARAGAKVLQDQLTAMNAQQQAIVSTKLVHDQDKDGKPTSKEIPAWDKTVMGLPPSGMKTHDPRVAALIAKAGDLASKSDKPVTIGVYVMARDANWVRGILDAAIPNGNKTASYVVHTVTSPSKAKLELTPIPSV
ncbi:TPA: hypothetical protein QDB15_000120 [Burkholderia vietnamiensis]|uniref:Glycine zipper domain-containing protein n=1 Tax=Pandoraea apista TaxID=93218 RepID=A0A5E5P1W3_9BURK|nr:MULTISPECIES: hypothetical protein [Burkholderiaceae]MCA8206394.1 hypothetical protein [Burkholderia vietnamiensis]VVG70334.1 hypothetical protein PAP18089_01294 [Pandoraea apista]HDR8943192.1 hypothetical protein [Burkholderia vietnamiensis]HDR9116396.1 hypothetical protein [Burkholderia vietnamiensis]HDR9205442.1 hypothetical protein [Burkholderia vietnamiensis]